MNEKTEENLNDIAEIVAKMKEYDGQKIGHNVDTFMIHCREKIIDLSGGEVNVDFNSVFTDVVSGTYHTYLICDSEIKEAINSAVASASTNTDTNNTNTDNTNTNTDNTNTNTNTDNTSTNTDNTSTNTDNTNTTNP